MMNFPIVQSYEKATNSNSTYQTKDNQAKEQIHDINDICGPVLEDWGLQSLRSDQINFGHIITKLQDGSTTQYVEVMIDDGWKAVQNMQKPWS